jgi:hypothetical protein
MKDHPPDRSQPEPAENGVRLIVQRYERGDEAGGFGS